MTIIARPRTGTALAGLILAAAPAAAIPPQSPYGSSYVPMQMPFSKSAAPAMSSAAGAGAGLDRETVEKMVAQTQVKIAEGCKLQGWQFDLTVDPSSLTRVELSPTLSPGQTLCVYQMLSDANIALDRPAPVQVQQSAIRAEAPK